jgi:hypothetical protein
MKRVHLFVERNLSRPLRASRSGSGASELKLALLEDEIDVRPDELNETPPVEQFCPSLSSPALIWISLWVESLLYAHGARAMAEMQDGARALTQDGRSSQIDTCRCGAKSITERRMTGFTANRTKESDCKLNPSYGRVSDMIGIMEGRTSAARERLGFLPQ